MAFTGDSSPGQRQNGAEVHVCQVGTSVTARRQLRGPGGLISPRTKDSLQPAVGHMEQLKGCEKVSGAGLAFSV